MYIYENEQSKIIYFDICVILVETFQRLENKRQLLWHQSPALQRTPPCDELVVQNLIECRLRYNNVPRPSHSFGFAIIQNSLVKIIFSPTTQ